MKHKRIGIKWKIFIYLLGFTAVLLILLWVLQTVYLEDFYKRIKINELDDAFENIQSVIDDDNLDNSIELIGSSYDICILVTDEYGNKVYSSEQNMQCNIHKLRPDELRKMINFARINGGTYAVKIENQIRDFSNPERQSDSGVGENENGNKPYRENKFHNMPDMTESESIIRIDIMRKSDGSEIVVMINTIITPMDATVHTLRIQLVYISIIMVVLSLIIAVIISWRISKPIIKINESARKLGKGDYDVYFDGNGYKEIAQLSDTLNHTTK